MNRYKAMNVAKNEEIRFSKNVNNFKIEKYKRPTYSPSMKK